MLKYFQRKLTGTLFSISALWLAAAGGCGTLAGLGIGGAVPFNDGTQTSNQTVTVNGEEISP